MGRSLLQLKLRVPRGEDGYWSIICELDKAGAWRLQDVVDQTNANKGTVAEYVKRLRLGGYIEVVGEQEHKRSWFRASALYRVAKPSIATPRLAKDGSPLPEASIEVLWRCIKMSRGFSARELHALVTADGRTASLNAVRTYLDELARVGVIRRTDGGRKPGKAGGGTAEAQYRLAQNLGAAAPKLLTGKIVYDPNARTVVGEASGSEMVL